MGGGETLPHPSTSLPAEEHASWLKDQDKGQEEFNVLVTGFGPFPGQIPVNSSNLVAGLLPDVLLPNSEFNPQRHQINILTPTAENQSTAVKVEYGYIRKYIKAMHDQYSQPANMPENSGPQRKIHLFIHIGVQNGQGLVKVEHAAYKQGFKNNWYTPFDDKHGYYARQDAAGQGIADLGPCPWDDSVPVGLGSSMDVDAVVQNAQIALAKHASVAPASTPVVAHHDAGYHCCGFIYYESLAQRYSRGLPGHVLFCHVPPETDVLSLRRSTDSICAVIGAASREVLYGKSNGREW